MPSASKSSPSRASSPSPTARSPSAPPRDQAVSASLDASEHDHRITDRGPIPRVRVRVALIPTKDDDVPGCQLPASPRGHENDAPVFRTSGIRSCPACAGCRSCVHRRQSHPIDLHPRDRIRQKLSNGHRSPRFRRKARRRVVLHAGSRRQDELFDRDLQRSPAHRGRAVHRSSRSRGEPLSTAAGVRAAGAARAGVRPCGAGGVRESRVRGFEFDCTRVTAGEALASVLSSVS